MAQNISTLFLELEGIGILLRFLAYDKGSVDLFQRTIPVELRDEALRSQAEPTGETTEPRAQSSLQSVCHLRHFAHETTDHGRPLPAKFFHVFCAGIPPAEQPKEWKHRRKGGELHEALRRWKQHRIWVCIKIGRPPTSTP